MTDPFFHRIHIQDRKDKVFVSAPLRYRAECMCGWVGWWQPTEHQAESEGQMHRAESEPDMAA